MNLGTATQMLGFDLFTLEIIGVAHCTDDVEAKKGILFVGSHKMLKDPNRDC